MPCKGKCICSAEEHMSPQCVRGLAYSLTFLEHRLCNTGAGRRGKCGQNARSFLCQPMETGCQLQGMGATGGF